MILENSEITDLRKRFHKKVFEKETPKANF